MKIIHEELLRKRVGEREALSAVERAFRALAEKRAVQPPPLGMEVESAGGEVHVKGAFLEGDPVFVMKVASGFYLNPRKGLPSGSGLVLVFDAVTGFPRGLLQDNGYLTEIRTGAAGALAVRLLAPDRPLTAAFLGTGSQARYQLRAMARVRTIQEVRGWSPDLPEARRFIDEMAETLGIPGGASETAEEAVTGADLVVTVTPAREPILELPWLESHATVVAVGSDGPEKQELNPAILGSAGKVVVDSLTQCLALGETHHAVDAGLLTPAAVHAELGEILVGTRPGREEAEMIVCDLTGVGAQDAAIGLAAWEMLGAEST